MTAETSQCSIAWLGFHAARHSAHTSRCHVYRPPFTYEEFNEVHARPPPAPPSLSTPYRRMNMDEICITPPFFIHRLRRPKVSPFGPRRPSGHPLYPAARQQFHIHCPCPSIGSKRISGVVGGPSRRGFRDHNLARPRLSRHYDLCRVQVSVN